MSLKSYLYRFGLAGNANDLMLRIIVVLFPLSIRFSNYAIIIFSISCLAQAIYFKKNIWHRSVFVPILINISVFLFLLISISYGKDLNSEIYAIEKFLPLLTFPILLNLINLENKINFFLSAFAYTICCMSMICISYGAFDFFFGSGESPIAGDFFNGVNSQWNIFSNIVLMRPFDISPIYMSLYVSFSIFVIVLNKSLPSKQRIFLAIFLLFFQIMIGSRIGLISFFICVTVILLFFVSKKIKKRLVILIMCSLVFLYALTSINPVLKKRFISDFMSPPIPADETGWNALNIRLAIWDCSIKSFLKSPIIGYGIASQARERERCYQQYSFYGPYGTNLNSHNQYLEWMLTGGIFLLVLFLLQLGYSFVSAINYRSILHLSFILLFILTCLGESVLETHKGIIFFSLFNSLFLFKKE